YAGINSATILNYLLCECMSRYTFCGKLLVHKQRGGFTLSETPVRVTALNAAKSRLFQIGKTSLGNVKKMRSLGSSHFNGFVGADFRFAPRGALHMKVHLIKYPKVHLNCGPTGKRVGQCEAEAVELYQILFEVFVMLC